MSAASDASRRAPAERSAFRHFLSIPTRWHDNDIYGHVNNVIYYSYFDTAINAYLIAEGGLDIHRGSVVGVCAESACRFHAGFSFPETIDAGLRVGRLSARSVRYELGLFRSGALQAAAEGHFVHVFVERSGLRPVPIPEPLREALTRLAVSE